MAQFYLSALQHVNFPTTHINREINYCADKLTNLDLDYSDYMW